MPYSLTTESYAKQICFKQKSLIIVKWSDKENASCEFQFLAHFPIDQPVWGKNCEHELDQLALGGRDIGHLDRLPVRKTDLQTQ